MEDVARHTVVTAETVFAATRKPRTNRLFLAVAVMAVLVVAGIGGWHSFMPRRVPVRG